MASFVTEVLASSGKLEKEALARKISKLSHKVRDTKEEVCSVMNSRYNDFLPSLQSSEELIEQVQEVSREMDVLKNCIDIEVQQNMHTSVTEYGELKQQLEKNTVVITMLGHLIQFHNAMEESNKALMEERYVEAAEKLKKAKDSMALLKQWKNSQLPLLTSLSSELSIQRENLLYHLGDQWKRLVVWTLPSSKDGAGMKSFLKVALNLRMGCDEEDSKALDQAVLCSVLQALALQGELQHRLKLFSQALLKYMLRPLVLYPSLSVQVIQKHCEGLVLALQCVEPESQETPSPAQVYHKLLLVLRTLHSHLLDVSIWDQKLSSILGDLIWEELSHCIIHECLQYSIPTDSSQLEKYSTVIKETEEFEKILKEMEFLHGDSTELLKYARKINCHFASKKCRDVIVAARKLMTSNMHDTVKISPESRLPLPKLPSPGGELKKQDSSTLEPGMVNQKQLSSWSMCLPPCRISKSVQQLMELALHTLSEAVSSSTQCAVQLFFTARNIFQLFYDVVPTYHKENLLKFPHLAAIQYNNCMYLAHHLLTLGHHFRAHLPQPLSEGVGTFVDMVSTLRKLGARCFLTQLNMQRTELLDRLSTAHNLCNLDDEDNYIAASKAVRQVIHQLKQLGTVWQDVLPVSNYCQAMGNLLNTAITEITAKVMALEDISSEEGEHLHTLCQTLIEEGPLVFTPLIEDKKNHKYQEEVALYVKKWSMFKELAIVLRANLQEIVDRWADGKGPLAVEFSSFEVKSLIRALFQNTERRAIALTKIK
ncbi:centromere/kinetochore protein zw10 homolog [Periophthalmus magnuspinnatus]|uniref:centromere/kinetochore protein zw10 homolog n=1 Tax=Periophthalmus magnuspinnatus TaxID=409849 RepID=UPI00145A7564|nr:centromere/kinetochore protein zw10 homolog [Periophthalmus magnuspinnatus]